MPGSGRVGGVNGDAPKTIWRQRLAILFAIPGLVLLGGVFFLSPGSHTLTFRLVDADTGAEVTNAIIHTGQRWTDLPLEKLRYAPTPFRTFSVQASNGVVKVFGVPHRSHFKFNVAFVADGYHLCSFERLRSERLWYGTEGDPESVRLPATNTITIAIRPRKVWVRHTFDAQNRVVSSERITNSAPRAVPPKR